jgi:hypothetical protein
MSTVCVAALSGVMHAMKANKDSESENIAADYELKAEPIQRFMLCDLIRMRYQRTPRRSADACVHAIDMQGMYLRPH